MARPTPGTLGTRQRGDSGAVLVHVAVLLIGFIAFSALAVDYGVLWASRNQAQNAADAGALAGALSLAYDAPDDFARARAVAAAAAQRNTVWGEAPTVDPNLDVAFPECPPGAPGLPDTCVRVDAYRGAPDRGGAQRSTPLPTFFAQLVGVDDQGVRATATAQVLTGNATDCLKPWAVADKWQENWADGGPATEPWSVDSVFDKYRKQGNQMVLDPSVTTPDVYVAPTEGDPGTGFTPFNPDGSPSSYYGLMLTLKIGSAQDRLSSGWFQPLDLPDENGNSGSGGADYRLNIGSCNPNIYQVGDTVPVEPGNMVGPTAQGVGDLIDKDPGAYWDGSGIAGSCAPGICADGIFYATSPRIVPIPLFDIDSFYAGSPNGKTEITISNIMGFFIEGMGGQGNRDVLGRLVAIPGLRRGGAGVGNTSAFLRTVILVR